MFQSPASADRHTTGKYERYEEERQMEQIQPRLDSFPAVHMTFELWVNYVYGYSHTEFDEHIQKLKIAYDQIEWSKAINTNSKQ